MMDKKVIARIAAIMAVVNLGHKKNISMVTATAFPDNWTGDAASDICIIAAQLFEDEHMEAAFVEEAIFWEEMLEWYKTDEAFLADFPRHEAWVKAVLNWHRKSIAA